MFQNSVSGAGPFYAAVRNTSAFLLALVVLTTLAFAVHVTQVTSPTLWVVGFFFALVVAGATFATNVRHIILGVAVSVILVLLLTVMVKAYAAYWAVVMTIILAIVGGGAVWIFGVRSLPGIIGTMFLTFLLYCSLIAMAGVLYWLWDNWPGETIISTVGLTYFIFIATLVSSVWQMQRNAG